MIDYWPGYLEYSTNVQFALVTAEFRRMKRTEEEAASLYRRLARQRVRFILNRLARHPSPERVSARMTAATWFRHRKSRQSN